MDYSCKVLIDNVINNNTGCSPDGSYVLGIKCVFFFSDGSNAKKSAPTIGCHEVVTLVSSPSSKKVRSVFCHLIVRDPEKPKPVEIDDTTDANPRQWLTQIEYSKRTMMAKSKRLKSNLGLMRAIKTKKFADKGVKDEVKKLLKKMRAEITAIIRSCSKPPRNHIDPHCVFDKVVDRLVSKVCPKPEHCGKDCNFHCRKTDWKCKLREANCRADKKACLECKAEVAEVVKLYLCSEFGVCI